MSIFDKIWYNTNIAYDTTCDCMTRGTVLETSTLLNGIYDSMTCIQSYQFSTHEPSFCLQVHWLKTRWWFQILFMFIPIPMEIIQFDLYFSIGLVQPPNSKNPIKVQRLSNLSRSALGLSNFQKLLRLLSRQLFRPDATWFTTLVPWLFWRKTPPED